jgi:hypothetical protein
VVIVFYTIDTNQLPFPTMNIPEAPDGTSLSAAVAAIAAGALYLRRFLSRQGVDIKKDSAEANLIATLQAERDKAMAAAEKAWETRARDAQMIGELTSEVRALRQQVAEMKLELEQMMQRNGHGPDPA